MKSELTDVKKSLVQYLLQKVKESDLDPREAAKYVKELDLLNSQSHETKENLFAIVGMSCTFPDANNKYDFWDNVKNGTSSMKNLSKYRKENFGLTGNEQMSQKDRGGYLECIDNFDYEYFNIPPKTAKEMDPYHRLMLQTFVETIEDAGYRDSELNGKRIGVFVGNDHTHRLITSYLSYMDKIDIGKLTGSWSAILASRISYQLNLNGPAMVVDTACSSSLVAIDIAIKSMLSGDCEAALIGGVNLFLSKSEFDMQVNAMDYMVRTFDERANGTVFSEGIAGIMIKPLADAIANHDNIQGIIRGVAINNDGKSNGITAPSAKAQRDVILRAWEKAEVSPESISYVEAHGTGTGLGDPIEIQGLTNAFRKFTKKKQFCAIGSIKTNIGHTVGAAGLASLIKVVMAMQKKLLPPSINFDIPNDFIDFCNSAVYVQDCLNNWTTDGEPRRAGVSSFSFAGTNAHVVLEEAPMDQRTQSNEEWEMFTLSGRDVELLRETTQRYLHHFSQDNSMYLKDICYTAGVGRHHYVYRAAIICKKISNLKSGLIELISRISDLEKNEEFTENIVVKQHEFTLVIGKEKLSEEIDTYEIECKKELESELAISDMDTVLEKWVRLAQYYVEGADVWFEKIYSEKEVKRCSLPPQPFKKYRLWEMTDYSVQDTTNTKVKSKNDLFEKFQNELQGKGFDRLEDESDDELEKLIAWIWSEVMGYSSIHRFDNFFSLGGDSINGYEIVYHMNKILNSDISVAVLLATPLFSHFVEEVRRNLPSNKVKLNEIHEIECETQNISTHVLPLSPPQSRMYRTAMMAPESLAYNITQTLRLNSTETYQKVNDIMQILCNRHEVFRTSFFLENETPMQVIRDDVDFKLEYIKVSKSDMSESEVLTKEISNFRRPFILEQAPLIRMLYLENEEGSSYLILDIHHIIIDGTSIGILLNEFKTLSEGRELRPLHNSYGKAVMFLNEESSKETLNKQREWWLEQYASDLPVLELPIDKARTAARNFSGSRVFQLIQKETYEKLVDFSKQSGATMFVTILGILHTLLARVCDKRDFGIGVAVTGHTNYQLHDVVGMFVNTLPLRIASTETESFDTFIARLRDYVYEAYNNQNYQYEDLVKELNVDRTTGHNPLFDVFFTYQNINMGLEDEEEENISFHAEGSKFDLSVSAIVCSEGLKMEWEYADSLFYQETIERIVKQFDMLIRSIVDNPNQMLGNLSILDHEEKQILLNDWNHTDVNGMSEKGIVQYFDEWVLRKGNQTALIIGDQSMSYDELNRRSNQIAHMIQMKINSQCQSVAIMLERSFDMVATMLAVLKAGCFYLPLDPETPKNRYMDMIEDSGARLLITHHGIVNEDLDNIDVLKLEEIGENVSEENLDIRTNGESNAYIMYTSGSTGKPKGIVIRMKSIIRVVKDNGYLEFNEKDKILQLSNYSFDGSVFDIYGALLNGATLVLIPKSQMADLTKVGEIIRTNKISIFFVTTALFNALVDTALDDLESTRTILFGGEVASVAHVNKAFERFGPGRICNVYGPTETTVFATYYYVNEKIESLNVPLGRAIGNTKVYVLDEQRRLLPVGTEGELYIGGEGLAKEYLNNPELTQERFVENPFVMGERLYKSGDIVKWEKDGQLHYISRKDNQVKLRGFRIELNEVQNVAQSCLFVQDAFAGVYEKNQVKHLCLWVITKKDSKYDEQKLRKYMEEYLPEYMIPTFIVEIDHFPLNKNKKVDKALLPAPVVEHQNTDDKPRNKCECTIVEIWKQVLGNDKVGIYDNFFAIGGDSIKAILAIAKMKTAGYEVSMEKLFKYQSIAELSEHLQVRTVKSAVQSEVVGECLPSVIQHSFLSRSQEINKFNHAMRFRVHMKYEKAKMESALSNLCRHHDMLRLKVEPQGKMQIRGNDERPLYYLVEISNNSWEDTFEEVLSEIQTKIDMKNGPLVAVGIKQEENCFEIIIVIHHLVVDVISWNIILEDLVSLLLSPNEQLPEKTDSFQAWTKELWRWGETGGAMDELSYWKQIATKAQMQQPVTSLTYASEDKMTKREICIKEFVNNISKENVEQGGCSNIMNMVLSIVVRSLCQLLERPEILINLEGHGRESYHTELDISRTVGWFTTTYPVLFSGNDKMEQVLIATKENLQNVPRKGFGYGVLRSLTSQLDEDDKNLLNSIIPQVSFNYLGVDNDVTVDEVDSFERLPSKLLIEKDYKSGYLIDIVSYQVGCDICLEINWYEELLNAIDYETFEKIVQKNAKEVIDCYGYESFEKTEGNYGNLNFTQDELGDIFEELGIG